MLDLHLEEINTKKGEFMRNCMTQI